MRIVFDPIIVNPDGISVSRHPDHSAALCYIDPKKLSAQGIREAVEYANTERAAEKLARYTNPEDVSDKDHLLNAMIAAPLKEQYRDMVREHGGKPGFAKHVRAFLNERLEQMKQQPDAALETLKADMARPLSAWEEPIKPPRLPETKQGYKMKLEKAIDALPPHLQVLMRDEKLTIACADTIMNFMPVYEAVSMPGSNSIGVTYDYLHKKTIPGVTVMLKEEVLHYFEQKMGVTENPHYRQAAEALLADDRKMQAIDAVAAQAHKHSGKKPVRTRGQHEQPEELFVDYFHIRDHLAARGGASAEAKANAQVEKLFGREIHETCQLFEASLKQKAAALGGGRAA